MKASTRQSYLSWVLCLVLLMGLFTIPFQGSRAQEEQADQLFEDYQELGSEVEISEVEIGIEDDASFAPEDQQADQKAIPGAWVVILSLPNGQEDLWALARDLFLKPALMRLVDSQNHGYIYLLDDAKTPKPIISVTDPGQAGNIEEAIKKLDEIKGNKVPSHVNTMAIHLNAINKLAGHYQHLTVCMLELRTPLAIAANATSDSGGVQRAIADLIGGDLMNFQMQYLYLGERSAEPGPEDFTANQIVKYQEEGGNQKRSSSAYRSTGADMLDGIHEAFAELQQYTLKEKLNIPYFEEEGQKWMLSFSLLGGNDEEKPMMLLPHSRSLGPILKESVVLLGENQSVMRHHLVSTEQASWIFIDESTAAGMNLSFGFETLPVVQTDEAGEIIRPELAPPILYRQAPKDRSIWFEQTLPAELERGKQELVLRSDATFLPLNDLQAYLRLDRQNINWRDRGEDEQGYFWHFEIDLPSPGAVKLEAGLKTVEGNVVLDPLSQDIQVSNQAPELMKPAPEPVQILVLDPTMQDPGFAFDLTPYFNDRDDETYALEFSDESNTASSDWQVHLDQMTLQLKPIGSPLDAVSLDVRAVDPHGSQSTVLSLHFKPVYLQDMLGRWQFVLQPQADEDGLLSYHASQDILIEMDLAGEQAQADLQLYQSSKERLQLPELEEALKAEPQILMDGSHEKKGELSFVIDTIDNAPVLKAQIKIDGIVTSAEYSLDFFPSFIMHREEEEHSFDLNQLPSIRINVINEPPALMLDKQGVRQYKIEVDGKKGAYVPARLSDIVDISLNLSELFHDMETPDTLSYHLQVSGPNHQVLLNDVQQFPVEEQEAIGTPLPVEITQAPSIDEPSVPSKDEGSTDATEETSQIVDEHSEGGMSLEPEAEEASVEDELHEASSPDDQALSEQAGDLEETDLPHDDEQREMPPAREQSRDENNQATNGQTSVYIFHKDDLDEKRLDLVFLDVGDASLVLYANDENADSEKLTIKVQIRSRLLRQLLTLGGIILALLLMVALLLIIRQARKPSFEGWEATVSLGENNLQFGKTIPLSIYHKKPLPLPTLLIASKQAAHEHGLLDAMTGSSLYLKRVKGKGEPQVRFGSKAKELGFKQSGGTYNIIIENPRLKIIIKMGKPTGMMNE